MPPPHYLTVLCLGILIIAEAVLAGANPTPHPLSSAPTANRSFSKVFVLGDLHGDLKQAINGLLSVGIISSQPHFYGHRSSKPTGPPTPRPTTDRRHLRSTPSSSSGSDAVDSDYLNAQMISASARSDEDELLAAEADAGSAADTYHWAAGNSLAVCTGDAMNVGPDDLGILRFLMRLGREANAVGGHLEFLLGNHEMRNLHGDFDGVHPWSFETTGGFEGRARLLSMKTDVGRFLRTRKVMYLWNHWLFVHGGISHAFLKAVEAVTSGPLDASTLIDRVNAAVIAVHTSENPDRQVPAAQRDVAKLVTNVDYLTMGTVNPLLFHSIKSCPEATRAMRHLEPTVTAQFVGHTPHHLPKLVYCEGKVFGVDFGDSKWKTGKGAAVGVLVLVHRPEDVEWAEGVAARSATSLYVNQTTLGNWTAVLSVALSGGWTSKRWLALESHYRAEIVALLLLVFALTVLIVIRWRRNRSESSEVISKPAAAPSPLTRLAASPHNSYGLNPPQ